MSCRQSTSSTDTWRGIVLQVGIVKVAYHLGITSEIVRRWVRAGQVPGGKNLKLLVSFIKSEVEESEFVRFLWSLSQDVFGLHAEHGERREAVNE